MDGSLRVELLEVKKRTTRLAGLEKAKQTNQQTESEAAKTKEKRLFYADIEPARARACVCVRVQVRLPVSGSLLLFFYCYFQSKFLFSRAQVHREEKQTSIVIEHDKDKQIENREANKNNIFAF